MEEKIKPHQDIVNVNRIVLNVASLLNSCSCSENIMVKKKGTEKKLVFTTTNSIRMPTPTINKLQKKTRTSFSGIDKRVSRLAQSPCEGVQNDCGQLTWQKIRLSFDFFIRNYKQLKVF